MLHIKSRSSIALPSPLSFHPLPSLSMAFTQPQFPSLSYHISVGDPHWRRRSSNGHKQSSPFPVPKFIAGSGQPLPLYAANAIRRTAAVVIATITYRPASSLPFARGPRCPLCAGFRPWRWGGCRGEDADRPPDDTCPGR